MCAAKNPTSECQTRLDIDANGPITTSLTTGALTLNGGFYANETLKLTYIDATGQTRVASGTPGTDRNVHTHWAAIGHTGLRGLGLMRRERFARTRQRHADRQVGERSGRDAPSRRLRSIA